MNYTKAEYAKLKDVSRTYITELCQNDRLVYVVEKGRVKIVDCPHNDKIFKK